ncbi:hypothetical protein PF008_g16426 [Phytophthora fragariae]|uniref:OTU domain-containing protein n=1 Tax=Phytophthora fragariae TaxID=53985 RepID=A0A6G0RBN5_9STRA|nr:hypothetical protein PF008_g16426 [Phytophthora fragariae]
MLTKTHAKFRRTYKGPVPPYAVGTATQYRHTDSDSLTIFLATLHRELAQSVAPSSTASTIPEPAVLVDERVRPPTVEVAGAQEVMAVEPAPGPQPTDDAETTPPSDGFTVVTRRAGRGQSRGPATTPLPQEGGRQIAAGDTPLANQRGGQSAATSQGAARSTKPQRQGGHQPLSTPRKSKEISKKARKYVSVLAEGFDKFKRDRAMGSFTALEDSYDDPEMEGSDHDDEKAPYAYVARPSAPMNVSGMDAQDYDPVDDLVSRRGGAALDVLARKLTTDSQGYLPNGQSQQALSQVRGEEVSSSASDTNMLSVAHTDLSSYVGSSQPSCTQSLASITGSEFPFSLDSELNQASTPVAGEESKSSTHTEGDNLRETGVLLNSGPAHAQTPSLSQDGFSIEGTKPAPGMPQQLPTFLVPFSGSLTKIPANGQCAYAALYASTNASVEPRLQFTSEVVKDANMIKRSIHTLMMINLANDVECKVVDPCRELKRLYPSQPAPLDVAVATAALYTHYEQERNRSVNAHIPSEFWAGPEVLRAMAQYLRERGHK